LIFHAVNNNFEGEEFDNSYSRKIYADMFIDDRNILGIPEWQKIYQMLTENKNDNEEQIKMPDSLLDTS
jgi:hypothetical protein